VPENPAFFCGTIPSNPELAPGKRGEIPHLRKDDGFRICLQAGSDSGRRDEQTNYGFGLEEFGAAVDSAKFVFT